MNLLALLLSIKTLCDAAAKKTREFISLVISLSFLIHRWLKVKGSANTNIITTPLNTLERDALKSLQTSQLCK